MRPNDSILSEDQWDEIAARESSSVDFDDAWESVGLAESQRWRMHRLLAVAADDSGDEFTDSILTRILNEENTPHTESTDRRVPANRNVLLATSIAASLVLILFFVSRFQPEEELVQEGSNMVLKVDRGKTRLTAGEGTRFAEAKDHTPREKHYRVEAGTLSLKVGKQAGSLRVSTRHLTAKVLGTSFDVTSEAAYSKVEVREGLVRVNSHGQEMSHLLLGQNEGVSVSDSSITRSIRANRMISSPDIDGNPDVAWNSIPYHRLERKSGGDEFEWKVGWTSEALFLWVEVKDEEVIAAGNRNPFHGDCVEVFLDGDHNRGSTYDGIDDYEIFFPILMPQPSGNKFSPKRELPEIDYASVRMGGGYRMEARIPFSLIKVTPPPELTSALIWR